MAPHLEREPDKTLALVAEMDMGEPELPPGAQSSTRARCIQRC